MNEPRPGKGLLVLDLDYSELDFPLEANIQPLPTRVLFSMARSRL